MEFRFEYIQMVSLIFGIYYLVCSIRWMTFKNSRAVWRMEIPNFVLVFMVVFFYGTLELDRIDGIYSADFYMNFSTILRLLTVLIPLIVLFYRIKKRGKGEK